MRFAALSPPKKRSPVVDWTNIESIALRERRCKGIRRARFEMVGIAATRIGSDKTIQRHREDCILENNEDGLNVLPIRRGLQIYLRKLSEADHAGLTSTVVPVRRLGGWQKVGRGCPLGAYNVSRDLTQVERNDCQRAANRKSSTMWRCRASGRGHRSTHCKTFHTVHGTMNVLEQNPDCRLPCRRGLVRH